MYSRYHERQDRSIQVPENYSGCAFSDRGDLQSVPTPRRLEVARPTPTLSEERSEAQDRVEEKRDPPSELSQELLREEEKTNVEASEPARPTSALPIPFLSGVGRMGKGFPFSHGMGFEELLLVGLILLLSQSGVGSDTVLWLWLLLFCG